MMFLFFLIFQFFVVKSIVVVVVVKLCKKIVFLIELVICKREYGKTPLKIRNIQLT